MYSNSIVLRFCLVSSIIQLLFYIRYIVWHPQIRVSTWKLMGTEQAKSVHKSTSSVSCSQTQIRIFAPMLLCFSSSRLLPHCFLFGRHRGRHLWVKERNLHWSAYLSIRGSGKQREPGAWFTQPLMEKFAQLVDYVVVRSPCLRFRWRRITQERYLWCWSPAPFSWWQAQVPDQQNRRCTALSSQSWKGPSSPPNVQ